MKGAMATILLLDDDPIVLELLRTLLEDAGYTPITAARLDDLPAGTRADLVVSDLVPLKAYSRETALEWVSALRERFGPAPVLVVTAHGAALGESDRLGAGGILGKPFDVEVLLQKVKELLGAGGQAESSGVGGQSPRLLHPEDAVADVLDRRMLRGREAEREDRPGVERIDDAVVPQARGRVVR